MTIERLDDLSDDERRALATRARSESDRQVDPRYRSHNPAERERLRIRWREVANALHPDPYDPDARAAVSESTT